MEKLPNPIHIIGRELRTTNDNGQSFKDIPPFWQRFMQESSVEKIPNKLDKDLYVVYTNFENAGRNNNGMYSTIIGCNVASDSVPPAGFIKVTIPADYYQIFPVEQGRPDKVGEVWQTIWAIPDSEKITWRFTCEFERYRASGEIDIFIGVNK